MNRPPPTQWSGYRGGSYNPAMDLDRARVGLTSLFTENGALLVVALAMTDEPSLEVLGMLLTRAPQFFHRGPELYAVYQVTRSGVVPSARGLGPRLYQYAMFVLAHDDPPGALQPDDPRQVSDAARHVWEIFHRNGWASGDDPLLMEHYHYRGDAALSAQLRAAEQRAHDYFVALQIPLEEEEIEELLWPLIWQVYDAAFEV